MWFFKLWGMQQDVWRIEWQLENQLRKLGISSLDRESRFGKEYLKLLVNEIKINGDEAEISDSYAILAGVIAETKKGTIKVPTFAFNWLLDLGSNQGHTD